MRLSFIAPFVLTPALSGAALAHSKTEENVPADGATVAEVTEISLAFDAPMRVIAIVLLNDGDEVAVERETGLDPVTAFRAVPAEPLSAGDYEFEWRGMSADGHPMQGEFAFTVAD